MTTDWKHLTALTQGQAFVVERVRLTATDIAIEGQFEPPALAKLTLDDQVFISAFIRCHGSIRDMEKYFGVSYPTIKNRLNRIAQQLEFVEIVPTAGKAEIISKLERGEITPKDAIQQLNDRQEEEI
jgi:hypothetical protein